jgi:hypothetical protein
LKFLWRQFTVSAVMSGKELNAAFKESITKDHRYVDLQIHDQNCMDVSVFGALILDPSQENRQGHAVRRTAPVANYCQFFSSGMCMYASVCVASYLQDASDSFGRMHILAFSLRLSQMRHSRSLLKKVFPVRMRHVKQDDSHFRTEKISLQPSEAKVAFEGYNATNRNGSTVRMLGKVTVLAKHAKPLPFLCQNKCRT